MTISDDDAQKKLDEAFAAFEATLREMLTAEARKSVDGAIARLSRAQGPFRLNDVEIEVVVRNLSVEAAGAASPPRRSAARARPAKGAQSQRRRGEAKGARTRTRGRPPGLVRTALLNAFEATGTDLDTDALRGHLEAAGVRASNDNLHQQLRRLVAAGELERSGRGVYRRAGNGGLTRE